MIDLELLLYTIGCGVIFIGASIYAVVLASRAWRTL